MSPSLPEPTRIPATTGVQPDAPNAKREDDHGLADGPPSTNDAVEVEPTTEE